MEFITIFYKILLPILIAYIAYNEREKHMLKNKLNKKIERTEMHREIEQTKEVSNIKFKEVKEDLDKNDKKLDRIENKLEKIFQRLLDSK